MKRAFVILLVLVVGVVAALAAVPYFFKDRIIALVKQKANERLMARLDFDGLDISLLRSFPQASVRLEGLRIVNVEQPFMGDTLFACRTLDLTAEPLAYLRESTVRLTALTLDKPALNLRIAGDSAHSFKNWDIVKPSVDAASGQAANTTSATRIALTQYSLTGGTLRFTKDISSYSSYSNDDESNAHAREILLTDLNHSGRGDFARDVFTLITQSKGVLNFTNGGVHYMTDVQTALRLNLVMDLKGMKFTFADNDLTLNALNAGFEGFFAMPDSTDDMEFDVRFATKNNEFKNLISLVPAVYSDKFSELKSSGTASIQGSVKGIYNDSTYPGFDIAVQAANGSFQYPKLPVAITAASLDARASSPGGKSFDATILSVRRCAFRLGDDPFQLMLELRTPISDPFVNLEAKGRVNLDNVKNLLPPEKLAGKDLSGIVAADVRFRGAQSAVQKKLYSEIQASGTITAEKFFYAAPNLAQTVSVARAELALSPQSAALKQCEVALGASAGAGSGVNATTNPSQISPQPSLLNLTGTLDNILGYVLNAPADSVLKGSLNLTSSYFNCNPWLRDSAQTSATAKTAADTTALAFNVPANLDFTFAARLQKVQYTNLALGDVQGKITVRDQTLRFENVGMKAFGGSLVLNGLYDSHAHNPDAPKTALDLKITSVDVAQTFAAFESLRAIAPMVDYMRGTFSAGLSLQSDFDGKLKPVWDSFNSAGGVTLSPLRFEGFKPLNQAADLLKLDFLRDPTILKMNPYYEIKNGRLYVKPFSVKLGGTDVLISGSNGLDKSIDYTLTVNLPADKIPSGTLAAVPALGDMLGTLSGALKSRPIPLTLKLTGTLENPVITPSVGGTSVGDAAKQALDAVQEEAKKRAQEEIEKAQQKLKDEADKKLKEAEQRAREEAERKAKEALKDKAPSFIKDIFGGKKDTTKH
jgi:hypothetical protein